MFVIHTQYKTLDLQDRFIDKMKHNYNKSIHIINSMFKFCQCQIRIVFKSHR